jgi:UDP-3-O-[3-hydroxymyristoyl] glucosamine N-acyltransferase
MTLSELARALGLACSAPEAATREITGVAGIEEAGPTQLTFVANPKYAPLARTTAAGAILVGLDFPEIGTPVLRTANPYLAFARAIELYYQPPVYAPGVHRLASVDPSARLGAGAHVGPFAVIGPDAVIGEDATILAHAVIYEGARIGHRFFAHAHSIVRENCVLGDDVTLQNGAIVGADGFGFAKDGSAWSKIVQSGAAVLGDRVEVQANACVDRASIGETRVHAGAKIDNLVQVGHGSTVGENTLLCAQVGLAGSSRIGRDVILAGQVGVAGHCTVGDGAVATAQSGIPSDVAPGAVVSGYPAIPNRQWLRASAAFARLPEMVRRLQKSSNAKD